MIFWLLLCSGICIPMVSVPICLDSEKGDQGKGKAEQDDEICRKEKKNEIAGFFQQIGQAQYMDAKEAEPKGNKHEKSVKQLIRGRKKTFHGVVFPFLYGTADLFFLKYV